MDEPKDGYYGGQVAAPLFKQIAERAANYLNIRPDLDGSKPPAPDILATSADSHSVKTATTRSLTTQ